MTAVAARRRGRLDRRPTGRSRSGATRVDSGAGEPTLFDEPRGAAGGEPTLDAYLSGVWEGLVAHRAAPCPVCGAAMAPGEDATGAVVVGRCGGCGTALS